MKIELRELLLLHFLNDGVRTTFVLLLPFVTKDLSLSLTQAGFLGSSQPLIAALIALPTGFLMSKIGGFRVLLSLLIIYSLGAIGVSFSFNIYWLFCMYFIAAIGFGMFHTIGFALTAKNSNESDVGRNMGNFTSIGEIGRVAIPPLAVFIASIIGWRITLSTLGIGGFLLFFVFKLQTPVKERDMMQEKMGNSQNHTQYLKDILTLFKQKHAFYISIAAVVDSLASSPIYVFLPFLLIHKGLSPLQLSIAMGGFFIGSLFGKTLLGRSVDFLGNINVFIVSEFCMATLLLFTARSNQYLVLLLLAALLGVFTKGTSPVVQTMFSKLSSKNDYHKVFAFSELIIGLSAVLTIITMGLIADKIGITFVFYISAGLASLATIPIYAYSHVKK